MCSHCVDRLIELRNETPRVVLGLGGTRQLAGYPIHIQCPVCRVSTGVPNEGLPVNYALCELIDRVHKTQELKRDCNHCQKAVNYGAQMFCVTCSQNANTPSCILCIKCALNEHAKSGHTIDQIEPASEEARRDAIQQITELRQSTSISVSECNRANESFAKDLEQYSNVSCHLMQ
ncbi:unnamed protein product [Anisakis simplex]|uniref:Uncharacterized protein n=1 Tax=Anisakis simplex TaxID=6269 RepID=A0A3P6T0V3_ANISI|nr:unnamed protein product [Anisakis simplex]